jgi:outer membrane protein OmpA-like peptidoglycan-associated protein
MKALGVSTILLCGAVLFSSCSSMNNTAKGGIIGGGSGAILGGLIGKAAGNAGVGAIIGTAVGAGAGVLIGNHMDKVKKQAEQVQNAKVEEVKDNNGLTAVKCTFDSGILFNTGKADLSSAAKSALNDFAQNVLNKNTDVDVSIQGYTDNQGWKNSTAAESTEKNLDLSRQRAQAVETYLKSCGVQGTQIKETKGFGEQNPVQDNSTEEGRKQNRRVEIYMYASKQMIESAQAGTLK